MFADEPGRGHHGYYSEERGDNPANLYALSLPSQQENISAYMVRFTTI